MIAFLIHFFICVIITILYKGGNYISLSRNRKTILLFVLIPIFFIHSLPKYYTLSDLTDYRDVFDYITTIKIKDLYSSFWGYKMEWGYIYWNRIVAYFTNDFVAFKMACSFLFVFCYFKIIRDYSPYWLISVLFLLLGPFFQSIFVLRQHIAIAILLLSIPYIINRKLIPFILITIIAILFHITSIIWLPMYFLYHLKDKKSLIITLVLITLLFYFMVKNLEILNSSFSLGYDTYINSGEGSNYTSLIIYSFYLFGYVFCLGGKILEDGINKVIFLGFSFLSLMCLIGIVIPMLSRLLQCYISLSILLFPITIARANNKQIAVIFTFIAFVLSILSTFSSNRISEWLRFEYEPIVEHIVPSIFFTGMIIWLTNKFSNKKYNLPYEKNTMFN